MEQTLPYLNCIGLVMLQTCVVVHKLKYVTLFAIVQYCKFEFCLIYTLFIVFCARYQTKELVLLILFVKEICEPCI